MNDHSGDRVDTHRGDGGRRIDSALLQESGGERQPATRRGNAHE